MCGSQASMIQTLRWRLGCSICLGREGSRTGQRDKLWGDAATTEASTVGVKVPSFIQRYTIDSPGRHRELVCALGLGNWGSAVS